jgi:hypothetical protein
MLSFIAIYRREELTGPSEWHSVRSCIEFCPSITINCLVRLQYGNGPFSPLDEPHSAAGLLLAVVGANYF